MLIKRPLLNTLLLLLALLAITQRVLTPFSIPALVIHPDGYIQICSWQSGFQPLLLNAEGERQESLQPTGHCPACTVTPALPETAALAFLARLPVIFSPSLDVTTDPRRHNPRLQPPSRAPPVTA